MFQLVSTLRIHFKTVSVFGLLFWFSIFFLYSFSQNNRCTEREGKGNEISYMQADPYLPDLCRKPVTSQQSSIVQTKSSLQSYFKSFVSQWSCNGVRAPLRFTSTQTWKQFSPGCSEKRNNNWQLLLGQDVGVTDTFSGWESLQPQPEAIRYTRTRDGFNC